MVSSLGPDYRIYDGFTDVHLRVEADAAKRRYQNYECQVPLFLRNVTALGLKRVNLAPGDANGRERDSERMQAERESMISCGETFR